MKAVAPGKVILSGEHAVVHGRPALVMAVDRYARAVVTPIEEDVIRVRFDGVFDEDSIPTAALPGLKRRLSENYQQFLIGEMGIRHVLSGPAELIFYAVMHAFDESGFILRGGVSIDLSTDLPVASGMGTSAAMLAATLTGLVKALGIEADRETLYRWTLDAEKLQHGHPSGVDPFIAVHGGCVRFQQGEALAIKGPTKPLQLVMTGRPEATTGECVADVSRRFPMTDPIWSQFEQVAADLEQALRMGDHAGLRAAVSANHRLLCRIGVVPARVQRFIASVEAAGGAAKICGAGSITGDNGGIVLVLGEALDVEASGYPSFAVVLDPLGAHIDAS
jgi:hydroxymethylglutaryl-CoA synthase